MSGPSPNIPPELQEAILELQQYLSDAVPPLVVADSIQLLLKYPPEAVLPTLRAWTAAQYRGGAGGGVPVSDYLFHALKKIHMMSEFKLVPAEPMNAYLGLLKPIVMSICPAEDRELLAQNLSRLGETTATSASVSPVQQIHRQMGTSTAASSRRASSGSEEDASPASPAAAGASAEALRRMSLLLQRLEASGALAVGPAPAAPAAGAPAAGAVAPPLPAPVSEALAFAARSSHSKQDLAETLGRLKSLGVETNTDNLFRALAMSLPGWVMPAAAGGASGETPAYEAHAIGAMRRIITDAEDPVEAGKRFHEMVKAGVERFNEGSLPQAVQMLELAERLVTEKKVDAGSAEIARRKLGESLDPERLKKFAEQASEQALLRKLLQFFTAYQPEGLLDALPGELKRDRRRLMLLLLEIHGAAARDAAFERLTRSLGPAVGEEEWYFRRNLLYLLRRVPRGPGSPPIDSEIDVILHHARIGLPLVVLKEAVAALGMHKDEKAEVGLAQLLHDIEAMLVKPPDKPMYDPKELRALLDRVAATLARLPSRPARRTLIEHAGRKAIPLGDTMSRLAELGSQNLGEDSVTVDQLIEMIRANLPFKLLGVTLRQNDQNLVHLVDALSGTSTPAVRKALEEIVAKFSDKDAARAATRAMAAFDRPAMPPAAERAGSTSGSFTAVAADASAPAASLQGDLEVFGLPSLLQSLADSTASGTLTLRELKGGPVFASIALRDGKLEEIRRGRLSGEDAFYQLFERPTPGQFAFVKGAPAGAPAAAPRPILPLTMEAMRRYDEFQESAALVPDAVFLVATEQKPTPHPGEKDGIFLQSLWQRASKGGTPVDCEEAVASDSYRIRRVLAHWVEEGSLKVRPA